MRLAWTPLATLALLAGVNLAAADMGGDAPLTAAGRKVHTNAVQVRVQLK